MGFFTDLAAGKPEHPCGSHGTEVVRHDEGRKKEAEAADGYHRRFLAEGNIPPEAHVFQQNAVRAAWEITSKSPRSTMNPVDSPH